MPDRLRRRASDKPNWLAILAFAFSVLSAVFTAIWWAATINARVAQLENGEQYLHGDVGPYLARSAK